MTAASLTSTGCPEGWLYLEDTDHCYFKSPNTAKAADQADAVSKCEAEGAWVIAINSEVRVRVLVLCCMLYNNNNSKKEREGGRRGGGKKRESVDEGTEEPRGKNGRQAPFIASTGTGVVLLFGSSIAYSANRCPYVYMYPPAAKRRCPGRCAALVENNFSTGHKKCCSMRFLKTAVLATRCVQCRSTPLHAC